MALATVYSVLSWPAPRKCHLVAWLPLAGRIRQEQDVQSYEVLKRAADTIGVKALAGKLRVSPALVYKWCQVSNPDDPDSSGARNPLDRLAEIVDATQDRNVVNWLCHEAGGFFVPNPEGVPENISTELLVHTQQLVKEFSQLLLTVTRSIEDDNAIEPAEADRIRDRWELFKQIVEAFTLACERGVYHTEK